MTNYGKRKENARAEAAYYYHDRNGINPLEFKQYFKKLGKRYGLLKEFRENGII